ncbi:MAG: YraN family protein [Micrococcus sp.]|nr:YraN family protein [Micrococcus sp.]
MTENSKLKALHAPSTARTALGRYGEDAARRWLQSRGYVVVDRNWRCAEGELDLVAQIDGWWAAVEVKTRSGLGYGDPMEAITPRKLRRLHRLMGQWHRESSLTRHRDPWRVDAVAVLVPPTGGVHFDLLQDIRP